MKTITICIKDDGQENWDDYCAQLRSIEAAYHAAVSVMQAEIERGPEASISVTVSEKNFEAFIFGFRFCGGETDRITSVHLTESGFGIEMRLNALFGDRFDNNHS